LSSGLRRDSRTSSDQTDTETDVSRREFLTKSTGTIAAAGAIAALNPQALWSI